MKAVVRFLAGVLLLVAVIFAIYDTTRAKANGHVSFTSISETWSALSPASLKAARDSVQTRTHPIVWNWGIAKLLQLPAWALLGLIGLLLAYAGRRRRQVNVYAN
jgi:hypothetical protein